MQKVSDGLFVCGWRPWKVKSMAASETKLLEPKAETPAYPFMQIGLPPQPQGGILFTIVYSSFEKRDIHIPQENAQAMCMAFMAQQPGEIIKQLIQMHKEAQMQSSLVQRALSNPRGPQGLKAVH